MKASSSEGSSADDDEDFEAQRAAARRGPRVSALAARAFGGKKTEAEKEAAFQKKLEQQK